MRIAPVLFSALLLSRFAQAQDAAKEAAQQVSQQAIQATQQGHAACHASGQ
jgi:hypothetical protein